MMKPNNCNSCYWCFHSSYDFRVLVCRLKDNEPCNTVFDCFEYLHFNDGLKKFGEIFNPDKRVCFNSKKL